MVPQNVMSSLQFLDKYSRYDYEQGRRETWEETVYRVTDYLAEVAGDVMTPTLYKSVFNAIYNKDVTPSMRLMATAGKGARRNQISIYNCSYLPLTSPADLHDITMLLGHGVGVGFSVENVFVDMWEPAPATIVGSYTFVVPDSIEGWALSFKILLENYVNGYNTNFDYSLVRPKGAPLLTRGGHASGPEPLIEAHNSIRNLLLLRIGAKLRSVDLFDVACHIAHCIVSGGVRRSAMIAIFDRKDELMLNAKSGAWWQENLQRQLANISQVIDGRMELEQWLDYVNLMDKNKSGEPGIWSRYAIKQSLPERRQYVDYMGPNPCFLKGTVVQTVEGPKAIEDIVEPTYVYSMDASGKLVIKPATAAWLTRENAETLRIKISSGSELCVTPEHKIFVVGNGWIAAKDLKVGDVVSHFKRARRGIRYAGVRLSTQSENEEVMEHRLVWDGVFGQLHDGLDIHHIDNNGYNNSLDNLCALPHGEHSTFTRNSCANNHQLFDDNGKFKAGDGAYKKQVTKMPYELEVRLGYFGKSEGPYITAIETGPVGDVYDLNVEDTHCLIANNIVAHNCVEQILRPRQFCNLNQVIARESDTVKTLKDKIKIATFIGTIQSAMLDFKGVSDDFRKNSEEERLLGVSISGIMDCPAISSGDSRTLDELKQTVISENVKWAKKLGINASTSTTCVKPDGNTSVLYDTSPGVHGRYAPYYIRRMRMQFGKPVANFAIASGIPAEPVFGETWDTIKTVVLSFPVKSPDSAVIQTERTAVEQLENWLKFKLHYTETNPSVTITYRQSELADIAAWLYEHQEVVVGLSFLPYDDHTYQQAPYEAITKEEYERLVAEFPLVDFEKFWEWELAIDTTSAVQNLACAGGACLI